MSLSAAHADAFYRDVAANQRVWTVNDDEGFPAPLNADGRRSAPFWSSLERVQVIIANVDAYAGFRPREISWTDFRDKWLPGLERDGLLVGVNWSGSNATGYDIEPADVRRNVEAAIGGSNGPD